MDTCQVVLISLSTVYPWYWSTVYNQLFVHSTVQSSQLQESLLTPYQKFVSVVPCSLPKILHARSATWCQSTKHLHIPVDYRLVYFSALLASHFHHSLWVISLQMSTDSWLWPWEPWPCTRWAMRARDLGGSLRGVQHSSSAAMVSFVTIWIIGFWWKITELFETK